MRIKEYSNWGNCTNCAELLIRDASGPTSQVKEILDNGVMRHSIERYAEAERLYKEREASDPSKEKVTYV